MAVPSFRGIGTGVWDGKQEQATDQADERGSIKSSSLVSRERRVGRVSMAVTLERNGTGYSPTSPSGLPSATPHGQYAHAIGKGQFTL